MQGHKIDSRPPSVDPSLLLEIDGDIGYPPPRHHSHRHSTAQEPASQAEQQKLFSGGKLSFHGRNFVNMFYFSFSSKVLVAFFHMMTICVKFEGIKILFMSLPLAGTKIKDIEQIFLPTNENQNFIFDFFAGI